MNHLALGDPGCFDCLETVANNRQAIVWIISATPVFDSDRFLSEAVLPALYVMRP